jgi:hypothetical protein
MDHDDCQADDYPSSLMMSQQRDRQKHPENLKISLGHHDLSTNHGAQNHASICDKRARNFWICVESRNEI